MTVRDWIERRPVRPPASLVGKILDMLGPDADADDARLSELCLGTAARALESLVRTGAFARAHASDLLAIDALTTYAFEHASHARDGARQLDRLSAEGTRLFGDLMAQRV